MRNDSQSGNLVEDRPAPRASGPAGDTPNPNSVLPIGLETLCAADLLDFDLYIQPNGRETLKLYRSRTSPLEQEDLDVLHDRGIRTLFILASDAAGYRDYLTTNVLRNESIPPAQRYHILREATRAVFLESLRDRNCDHTVKITAELGQQLMETICRSNVALLDLFQVMSHDYSTFTHALNVATYGLLIARAMGVRDDKELVCIGQGALLHDIGKQRVAISILEKKGRLDDRERQAIMQHPTLGFRDLCRHPNLDWGQAMMVYQHHERCDGQGYPVGLAGPEIHYYAKLCAIADVCDALMRDRPYRKASMRGDVVEYMDRQAGRGFDEEMTRCWIATIQQQT